MMVTTYVLKKNNEKVSLNDPFYLFLSVALSYYMYFQFWARLFKTNDVVSKRFVKFSEVNFSNMPIFFVEKL